MNSAPSGFRNYFFSKHPILIIDRDGLIGDSLSLKLSKEFLVVFVSRRNLILNKENKNLIRIPFLKKFPVIPDSKYSHVIFIDEGGQDLEFLPRIINKIRSVNADFIAAFGLSPKGEYAVDKVLQLYGNAKTVIFGDIFDNELILRRERLKSTISKFLYQAKKFGKIQIPGEGLRDVYPVFLHDAVNGLIELVFGMHKTHSLFYIFPKHPPTELSLAHMIQRANPEVTVDFVKYDPRLKNISYPSHGLNLLSDKYPLAKKIRKINIKKISISNINNEGNQGGSLQKNTKKLKNPTLFIFWMLIFLLLAPFAFTMLFSSLGLNTFYYAKREANRNNFENVKKSLHLSQTSFYLGKQALNVLFFQAKILGRENSLKKLSRDIDLGYKISESLVQSLSSESYFINVLTGKSEKPIEDFEKAQNHLKNLIVTFNRLKTEEDISAFASQSLKSLDPLIKFLSETFDIMPDIFGMEEPRTYLILFQDNKELRPSGGIIDSYGILKLNNGKITEYSVRDVNDADKQLRGHAEPPFAIRRYLSQQHWYLKDSGYDVDFVKSASSSSNFLFAETGEKVDGVIGVDSSFVRDISRAMGSEENIFSDSMQKIIMSKLESKKMPYFLIAKAISDTLSQKHLLFAFNNASQNIFTVNGWSSSLWDERKNDDNSINDFLGINETNLGKNKINSLIKRKISQKVVIGEGGGISEELTINFKNENETLPGENYKAYLRIILPQNTELSEISIDDVFQKIVDVVMDPLIYEAKKFKAPQGIEVEEVSEEGKTMFGFIVDVPPGKIVKIKLKYALERIPGLNFFSYNLKLFKQPGIDSIPYSLSLSYPDFLNIIKSPDKISKTDEGISYAEKIMEDKNLIINFAKNN